MAEAYEEHNLQILICARGDTSELGEYVDARVCAQRQSDFGRMHGGYLEKGPRLPAHTAASTTLTVPA